MHLLLVACSMQPFIKTTTWHWHTRDSHAWTLFPVACLEYDVGGTFGTMFVPQLLLF